MTQPAHPGAAGEPERPADPADTGPVPTAAATAAGAGPNPLPPHRDPARFDEIVESAGPDSLVVVIDRDMGPLVRGWCTAEDVLQDALAAAWRDGAQHDWVDVRTWRAWLLGIARNRLRMVAREAATAKRGGGAAPVRLSDTGSDAGSSGGGFSLEALLPAGSSTPSRIASARERSVLMREALAALPPDVEPVVRKHLFEELPMESIAAEAGLSVSAAWRRFRKGVEEYARRLAALRSGPGACA